VTGSIDAVAEPVPVEIREDIGARVASALRSVPDSR